MENLYFPEFFTCIFHPSNGYPWQCGSLLVIAEGEEFLLEKLYFPEFLTCIFHPSRWMPLAMRKPARHSRGRGVLVGEPIFP